MARCVPRLDVPPTRLPGMAARSVDDVRRDATGHAVVSTHETWSGRSTTASQATCSRPHNRRRKPRDTWWNSSPVAGLSSKTTFRSLPAGRAQTRVGVALAQVPRAPRVGAEATPDPSRVSLRSHAGPRPWQRAVGRLTSGYIHTHTSPRSVSLIVRTAAGPPVEAGNRNRFGLTSCLPLALKDPSRSWTLRQRVNDAREGRAFRAWMGAGSPRGISSSPHRFFGPGSHRPGG